MQPHAPPLPRLPVLGWQTLVARPEASPLPAVTDGRSVVFASAGRAAIFLALDLLGVGAGDRVMVPTYHCPTMIAPITRLGATPVFYPIGRTASADLEWLAAADTTGVKALLAAHYFGLPQPMDELRRFCSGRGITLIEDCAHAFFGRSGATPVGKFGDLTIASLPKFFPVMEGGCLIGPPELLDRARVSAPSWVVEFRTLLDALEIGAQHGRFGWAGRVIDSLASIKRRVRKPAAAELPDALPNGVDAEGLWLDENLLRRKSTTVTRWIVQHSETKRLIERRRANYLLWSRSLVELTDAKPLFPTLAEQAVPYVFPLLVRDSEKKYQALRASGVPIFRWDIAWPGVPQLAGDEGKNWLSDVFQLGCHQDLDESDILRLVPLVRRVLQG